MREIECSIQNYFYILTYYVSFGDNCIFVITYWNPQVFNFWKHVPILGVIGGTKQSLPCYLRNILIFFSFFAASYIILNFHDREELKYFAESEIFWRNFQICIIFIIEKRRSRYAEKKFQNTNNKSLVMNHWK